MGARIQLDDLPPSMREQARAQLGNVPRETPQPKYHNVRVEFDGLAFDSKWEMHRYQGLLEQSRAGIIRELRRQVPFPLHVVAASGERVCIAEWVADFTYTITATSQYVIEDTKSAPTRKNAVYQLKARMVEAEYGLKITEVLRPRRRT